MRIKSIISLFAASLIGLLPTHALAQTAAETQDGTVSVRDRDRPEYDPLGVRLGTFNLNAGVDFDIASTDNLLAADDSMAVEDIFYEIAPTVSLASDWSSHALTIDAGATIRTHDDLDNEDADSHYIRGVGRFDIGRSTALHGSARAAHQFTPRTDPDSPTVGSPVEYDRLDTSAGISHRFARFGVRADVGRSEYDYDGVQNFRDNEETFLRGRIDADLSPRIGLVLQASSDEREYENTPTLDSEGHAILAGVTLNTDLMRGELMAGQFEREYSGAAGTFDGLALAGRVEWYVTRLTTITFDGRRDADDQIGATSGEPFITSEFGGRVDHELLRNVILTGSYRMGERDYDIDRNDEYNEVEVGADYLLNRRVALRGRYERSEVESSGALAYRDYEVNQFTVGLSLRL